MNNFNPLTKLDQNLTDLIICHSLSRHLLQLHHDDGGEQRGVDGGGAQLSPQDSGDPRDAHVGPQCLPPVAPLDTQDGSTGKNH